MKGSGHRWGGGVMCQDTHLHGHGLPRVADFNASSVHGAQVHQHGPVILIQQHIGGLEVPAGMDITEHPLGSLPPPTNPQLGLPTPHLCA